MVQNSAKRTISCIRIKDIDPNDEMLSWKIITVLSKICHILRDLITFYENKFYEGSLNRYHDVRSVQQFLTI